MRRMQRMLEQQLGGLRRESFVADPKVVQLLLPLPWHPPNPPHPISSSVLDAGLRSRTGTASGIVAPLFHAEARRSAEARRTALGVE